MTSITPIADPAAPLARRNPTAKLLAAALLTLCLVVSLDPVTPAVVLAAELLALPAFGIGYAALLRRAWPVLAASLAAGASYLFFAERTGAVIAHAGPLVLTTGVAMSAASLVLRLLAVVLPSIAVFASTDPTELADSLVQNARLPARFVIGALAAVRLLPLIALDWQTLRLARRARGLSARGPLAWLRMALGSAFALLVLAIRRGTRLATAMDARGFDAGIARGIARPQRFGFADAALVAAALAVGLAALAASIRLGTFNPVLR